MNQIVDLAQQTRTCVVITLVDLWTVADHVEVYPFSLTIVLRDTENGTVCGPLHTIMDLSVRKRTGYDIESLLGDITPKARHHDVTRCGDDVHSNDDVKISSEFMPPESKAHPDRLPLTSVDVFFSIHLKSKIVFNHFKSND
ncbi:hypothetical protein Btru_038175 [Bulinus truncatus]|nr:hypothetical protein Btru_038175 [Bulinus truncatus]